MRNIQAVEKSGAVAEPKPTVRFSAIRNIWAIARKEIGTYVSSPIAYVMGAIFVALSGLFFSLSLGTSFPEASLAGFMQPAITLLVVIAPLLTMRLLAEEQKMGTLELLLTSPVRDEEVVLGKFLGSLLMVFIMFAITLYFPILLFIFGDPDPMPILTGYLGLVLVGATLLSIGIFSSSITSNQIIAAVVSLGIGFALLMLGSAATYTSGAAALVLDYLSLQSQVRDLTLGILDTRNLIFFIGLITLFLFLTIRNLESRRWR